jgi:type III restriction enzyme
MGDVDRRVRDRYQKMAKNLKRGLVYGNPHSVIGLLCACFDFALNDKSGLDGVFEAVRDAFRLPGSRKLLERMTTVNDFRNTYIAHHEKDLTKKELAELNLKHWVETLVLLKA